MNRRLQRAWNQYGEDSFAFEVLERVVGDGLALLEREQAFLDAYRPAYNINPLARANGSYHTLLAESRKIISEKHKARFAAMTDEQREAWNARLRSQSAKAAATPVSDSTKAKHAESLKDRWAKAKAAGINLHTGKPPRKPLVRWCSECGAVLPKKAGMIFVCSEPCHRSRDTRQARELRATGALDETRSCAECGSSFTVHNKYKTTKTCSKRCAALRWRRSQRAAA